MHRARSLSLLLLRSDQPKKRGGDYAVSPLDFGPTTAQHSTCRGVLRMDRDNHSISPRDLYERLGSEAAPIVVDIRRDTDFLGAERVVAPAFHRSPDRIDEWGNELPRGRTVVTYCAHGE